MTITTIPFNKVLFRKLRNLESDPLSFIDMHFDIASWSASKNVRIKHASFRTLIVENDIVIKNAESLFSRESTLNLLPHICISDYMEVFTGDEHLVFDGRGQSPELTSQKMETFYEGLQVVMYDYRFPIETGISIEEFLLLVSDFYKNAHLFYNGKEVEKSTL